MINDQKQSISQQNLDLLRAQLLEYTYRQTLRYEDDITELNNHTVYRKADPLDHLEMIMAQTRLATAEKIFADIRQIVSWSIHSGNYTK